MKTSTFFSLILCLLFLASCNQIKRLKVLKSGTVSTSNFVGSIPFDFNHNLPFVSATIEGKEYRFLFDTGAPCVISTELYQQLKLKKSAEAKIGDSNGVKEKQIYTILPHIKLGDVIFQDIGVVVMNLSTSEIFECLDFDGIIGANLMRTAKWEIDYQDETLRFSNDIKKLNTDGESFVANFNPVASGTPYLDITVDEITVKGVTFDTGSSGYITLPAKYFKELYLDSDSRKWGYGISSYGAYGAGSLDTSFYVKTKNIAIGELAKANKMIELENRNKEILGNLFLKNYRVIMDWEKGCINLYPTLDTSEKNENLNNFGYETQFENQKVTISYIFNNSSADKAGLKVGDEVIEIAGQKTTGLSPNQRCDLLFKSYEDLEEVSLIVLRNGEKINYSLKRTSLF
jgi:predicted aspartyl protease